MPKEKLKKGFTLIELLTVITIMGILVSIAYISFSNAQLRGRDSKRKTDIDNLKKAIELAKADTKGQYFVPYCTSRSSNDSCGLNQLSVTLNPTYIAEIPTDPKTRDHYRYAAFDENNDFTCTTTCTAYFIFTCLENTKDSQGTPDPTFRYCPSGTSIYYMHSI